MLAYLLRTDAKNKPLMQTSTGKVKRPGKPCGKSFIAARYKCGRHFTNGKLNAEGKAARAEFLGKVRSLKAPTETNMKPSSADGFISIARQKHGNLLDEIDSYSVPREIWQKKNALQEAVKTNPSLKPQLRKAQQAHSDAFDSAMAKRAAGMTKLRDTLLAGGDAKAAKRWAAKLAIAPEATLDKKVTKTSIRATLAEFHQMTKGKNAAIENITNVSTTASASNQFKRLNIGFQYSKNGYRETMFHESGHFAEYSDPAISKAARQWRDRRATDPKPVPLREIDPAGGHRADAVGVRGKFLDPYVGRVYKHGSTEVISMGLERFSSPEKMAWFLTEDREYFEFVLGVIESDYGARN